MAKIEKKDKGNNPDPYNIMGDLIESSSDKQGDSRQDPKNEYRNGCRNCNNCKHKKHKGLKLRD